ncbi:hypothetical protein OH799_11465 [Nocardia sp. NBC_00881]|uniref:hypothetical protein n=1 Tax=Nocardia sp. NBC_00881 TaxID=2975995 RepID=UPI0038694E2D|nr:hypothetical protein OH799_11465 [Nocardia sp. NBC_00881]
MTTADDDALMTADQQALLHAVVDAINRAARPVTPAEIARFLVERIHPVPSLDDISAVVHILELPAVGFQRGEASGIVLARVLDVLEAATASEEFRPLPPGVDDRF